MDDGYFVKIIRGEDKKILDKFVAIKALKNHKKYGTDRTFVSIVFNKKYLSNINQDLENIDFYMFETFILVKDETSNLMLSFEQTFDED